MNNANVVHCRVGRFDLTFLSVSKVLTRRTTVIITNKQQAMIYVIVHTSFLWRTKPCNLSDAMH